MSIETINLDLTKKEIIKLLKTGKLSIDNVLTLNYQRDTPLAESK